MEGNMNRNISEQMTAFNQTIYYGLNIQSSKPTVLRHVEVFFFFLLKNLLHGRSLLYHNFLPSNISP